MVKFTVGLLIAAAVAAPAFVNGAPVAENIETREVAEQDVFGRAVADALSDVYTREEMADILERDVEDFDARELEVLFSRELEFDDSLVTREMVEELEARQPLGGLFGRIKNFFVGKPKPKAPEETAEPAAKRELEVEVRAEAAAPPAAPKPKHEPNIFEKFIALFRNTNHAGAKKAAQAQGAKKGGNEAAAPAKDAAAPAKEGAAPAAEAPAAEAPAAEAPAEAREYFDQDLYERELLSFLEEPVERSFEDDEDMFERDFDEELVEREADELLERDFDEELFERELQDMLFEREFSFDELD